jgi:diaminopimelate decarboxylase
MNHFDVKDGRLHAEDVDLEALAIAEGTPCYVYSSATLTRHYTVFDQALDGLDRLVCFAAKANSNQAVLATLAKLGAGCDVVSGGELARALAAGIPPGKIVFSGVGKSRQEMEAALDAGIFQLNVEGAEELDLLSSVAADRGLQADVALRVNPDVDAGTHAKISTGKGENKFGIAIDRVAQVADHARNLPGIRLRGLAVHIGSQLTDLAPLETAFKKVIGLWTDLRAQGHALDRLDLGGGLGIPYRAEVPPLPAAYGAMVKRVTEGLPAKLIFEPGRLIAGNAGILLSRVLFVKHGSARNFLILDAAMNDLIRPAMYDSWHEVQAVHASASGVRETYDIVGPVCESSDIFAKARDLPILAAGDLVAIMSAGAYGAVMSSTYNSRALVPEILVRGGDYAVIRPRETVAEIINRDRMPDWLTNG